MDIPWPVAFGACGCRMAELWLRSLQLPQPEIETSTRFSLKPYQIHHCLPCTYGQPIAPLQQEGDDFFRTYVKGYSLCSDFGRKYSGVDQCFHVLPRT
jgi:hypothetical protein